MDGQRLKAGNGSWRRVNPDRKRPEGRRRKPWRDEGGGREFNPLRQHHQQSRHTARWMTSGLPDLAAAIRLLAKNTLVGFARIRINELKLVVEPTL